jgi:hypothetical protein
MTYAIIECINGSFFVQAEGLASIEAAKVQYHGRCQTLWNASDVLSAYVMIVDTQLDVVEGCKEYIHHEAE